MFGLFKRTPVYLKIYPDKMEIINLQTGDSVVKNALVRFSTERLVIADFNAAEKLARELKKELGLRGSLKVLAQQMTVHENVITEAEKRMLRDLAEQMGATAILIATNDKPLTHEEALEIVRTN